MPLTYAITGPAPGMPPARSVPAIAAPSGGTKKGVVMPSPGTGRATSLVTRVTPRTPSAIGARMPVPSAWTAATTSTIETSVGSTAPPRFTAMMVSVTNEGIR